MQRTRVRATAAALALACSAVAAAPVDDIVSSSIATLTVAPSEQPLFDESVAAYIAALSPDGSFNDINYTISEPSYWPTMNHSIRARRMAQAYESNSSAYYRSAALLADTTRVVDWWLVKDPAQSNWWYAAIGIPEQLAPPLLSLQRAGALAPNQTAAALTILRRPSTGAGTDANVVWEAVNMLFCGCFAANETLVAKATAILWGAGERRGRSPVRARAPARPSHRASARPPAPAASLQWRS